MILFHEIHTLRQSAYIFWILIAQRYHFVSPKQSGTVQVLKVNTTGINGWDSRYSDFTSTYQIDVWFD